MKNLDDIHAELKRIADALEFLAQREAGKHGRRR